jgi:hypothetical protein
MAKLGGPGLQRVLRIVLTDSLQEVHYEEPIGHKPTDIDPLSVEHESLLQKTLTAIHRSGCTHGSVAASVLIERHGPILLVAGQGPLTTQRMQLSSEEAEEQDLYELEALCYRRSST